MKKLISRRQFLAAAGVAAAAGVLTACGGSSPSPAASTSPSTGASPASSGGAIQVGVAGPPAGNVSVYGPGRVNGATP